MFTELGKVDFGERNANAGSNGIKHFFHLPLLLFNLLWSQPANIIQVEEKQLRFVILDLVLILKVSARKKGGGGIECRII